jgi:Holliday junction resolvasome RuvABC ATP-dependent DNA helicase subunit
MRTTLTYSSVTFGSNGEVVNTDLESHVRPNNVVHDSQKSNIGIATRTGGLTTYNTGSGMGATHRQNATQVQLRAPTGLVKVGGFEVTPEVAQTLTEAAPEMFVAPKAAEAAKVADAAREDAAKTEELGRHADDTLEAYHQHVVGEVSQQNLIGLMVYGQKGETPPADLLKTISDQMGEPLGCSS